MDETRFIIAGNLIDGLGNPVRRKMFLAVKGTVITAIGPLSDLPFRDASVIDDYSHCTIVPAMVDCSLSLSRSPSVNVTVQSAETGAVASPKAQLLENHIRYCHMHGILGVADNDNIHSLLKKRQSSSQHADSIFIRIPSPIHPCRPDFKSNTTADTNFIKIRYSGDIEGEKAFLPLINQRDLRRILQHKGRKKAMVVANGQQLVREAIEAGCDAIEQGYNMGEDNLRTMAKKSILWLPSALRSKNALDAAGSGGDVCCRFSQRYIAPGTQPPEAEHFWEKMLSEQLSQLELAQRLGMPTALGTGAGYTGILHGESVVEEMKLFIKSGYSLEEAICCASETGARFFGLDQLGALSVNRTATFLIARGSVKQLPRKLSYLEGIYMNGLPSPLYQKTPH